MFQAQRPARLWQAVDALIGHFDCDDARFGREPNRSELDRFAFHEPIAQKAGRNF